MNPSNLIASSINQIESISELQRFLKTFTEEMEQLRNRVGEDVEIPKFYIPNWPSGLPQIRVICKKRTVLYPIEVDAQPLNSLLRLEDKIVSPDFFVSEKGTITIKVYGWRKSLIRRKDIYPFIEEVKSESNGVLERKRCFIIFSQFLQEISTDIVRQLNKKLISLKNNVNNYEPIIEAVKKSFEPLIPFVVADILNEERS